MRRARPSRRSGRSASAGAGRFLNGWLERHIAEYDIPLVEASYRPIW
jgi:hypothetical protein